VALATPCSSQPANPGGPTRHTNPPPPKTQGPPPTARPKKTPVDPHAPQHPPTQAKAGPKKKRGPVPGTRRSHLEHGDGAHHHDQARLPLSFARAFVAGRCFNRFFSGTRSRGIPNETGVAAASASNQLGRELSTHPRVRPSRTSGDLESRAANATSVPSLRRPSNRALVRSAIEVLEIE